MTRIGWIHLSDLLMNSEDRRSGARAMRLLLDDLAEFRDMCGPYRVVFISGNLTAHGLEDEFELTAETLDPIRSALDDPWIMTTPGNHDVFRTERRAGIHWMKYWQEDEELREAFWNDYNAEIFSRGAIDAAFENYALSRIATTNPGKKTSISRRGVLPGDFTASLKVEGLHLGVLGLNTTFLSLADDSGPGAIGLVQARAACGGGLDAWAAEHDLCVLLTHHPPSSFTLESQHALDTEIAPSARIAAHFCGAAHAPSTMRPGQHWISPGASLSLTRSDLPFGYTAGFFERAPGGAFKLRAWPRTYSQANKKFTQKPRYALDRNGATRSTMLPGGRRSESTLAHPGARIAPEVLVGSLELRNFACFENISLDFDRSSTLPGKWTCLAGINGSGKTSLLQALCLVLLGERQVLQLGAGRLQRMRRMVDGVRRNAEITARVWLGSGRHRLALTITDDGVKAAAGSASANEKMGRIWEKISKSHLVLSYGATRNLADYFDRRYKSMSRELRRQMTLFDPLTQVANAEAILEKRRDEQLMNLLTDLIRVVYDQEMGVEKRNGELKFTMSNEPVDALDLPDGFRSSVAWLADLASAWLQREGKTESAKPDRIKATVLIDELDLHLHPMLQRTIVPRLRKALPRVQWIVSTHSPLVLSSFDVNELMVLNRDAEGGVQALDRQILGFSTDDVHRWLMGTSPRSAALEDRLAAAADGHDAAESEELGVLLAVSPEADAEQAKERVRNRRRLLKKLKER